MLGLQRQRLPKILLGRRPIAHPLIGHAARVKQPPRAFHIGIQKIQGGRIGHNRFVIAFLTAQ